MPDDWTGSQEDYRATITPNVGTGSALYWKYDFVGKMNDEIVRGLNTMSERYMPYLKQPCPEDLKMTADEYDAVELINATLEPQLENLEYNFITGASDPYSDADWQTYLSRLEQFGYKDLESAYNDAYNRNKAE